MGTEQSIDVNISTVLDQLTVWLATFLFFLVLALTTTQVVVRQLPLIEIAWTEPLARFVFIVMTYVGAAVALRNNELLSIHFLLEKLKEKNPRVYYIILLTNSIIITVFLGIATLGAIQSSLSNWATVIGGVHGLTSGYIYLGIALGMSCMLIYAVDGFRSALSDLLEEIHV